MSDAFGVGLGAILMHDNRPIIFHSQVLKGKHLHLSTYETELLAIATAVKMWRPYLLDRVFIVRTDHQSLKFLLEQRIGTPAQQKWLANFFGYAFIVEYKKGVDYKAADALSTRPTPVDLDPALHQMEGQQRISCLFLLSVLDPTWLAILKDSYAQDQFIQQILHSIQAGVPPKGFTFQNG